MELRLIIADFDGTLADTRKANAAAYTEALREAGYRLSEEEYLEKYFGMRCPEFMRRLGITDPRQIEWLRRRKIELYPSHFASVSLNHPLWEFCRQFRAGGGKLWIVSTGQEANIRNAMTYLGLTESVDGLLCGGDVTHPKPDPEAFLRAMEAEGCTPTETLIFEDSPVGIEAARRSGAAYIRVRIG